MTTIPYQASYSLSSKYGNRYGPSGFAPSTTNLTSPQTLGVQTPATQGVGAGPSAAQPAQVLAYNQDPFAQTAMVNGVQTQGVGFVPTQSAATISPPDVNNTGIMIAPTTSAEQAATSVDQSAQSFGFSDDSVPGYGPATEALGYTPGQKGIPELAMSFIPGGSFLADAIGNQESTYGHAGTYDPATGALYGFDASNAEGGFGTGQAYDPVTGKPVATYSSAGAALTGMGDSVGSIFSGEPAKLAALNYGFSPASEAGLTTTQDIVASNTLGYAPGQPPTSDYVPQMVSPEMLNITKDTARYTAAQDNTGVFGAGTGDIAQTAMGPGVVNESGQIVTSGGTVVSITDPTTGEKHSLLGTPEENKNKIATVQRNAGLASAPAADSESSDTYSRGTAISDINQGRASSAIASDAARADTGGGYVGPGASAPALSSAREESSSSSGGK